MISRAEVDKLAELARLDLSEEERDRFGGEMGQILDYIDQLKAVDISLEKGDFINVNTLREDRIDNEPGEFTARIVSNMPDSEDQLLKIHKILGGDE